MLRANSSRRQLLRSRRTSRACSRARDNRCSVLSGTSAVGGRWRDLLRRLRPDRPEHRQYRSHAQRGVRARRARVPPQAPQTGWWWNTAEGGRGYSIEVQRQPPLHRGVPLRREGRATWNVAPGATSLDGSLFTARPATRAPAAQTLGGAYRAPTPAQRAARSRSRFTDATHGTMVWPGGTVAIERFDIVPGGLDGRRRSASVPESGWWWNPAESGRGFFIEWQNGTREHRGLHVRRRGQPDLVHHGRCRRRTRARSHGTWWLYANGQTMTRAVPARRRRSAPTWDPTTIQFTSATTRDDDAARRPADPAHPFQVLNHSE